jgi:cobalt-zinc-cadmium efflux system protein
MGHHHVEKALKIGIALTFIFFIVELIGGYVSGSLSLLSDAGHMFRDVFALFASLWAISIAKKLPSPTKTFGYHRIEILSALVSGLLLVCVSAWIAGEAYSRFFNPTPVEGGIMFVVAVIGLIVNIYVATKLHGSHDLNVKSAFLHVLTDTFSSVAVIIAAIWIYFTGQTIVDPILSMFIAAVIFVSALFIIKDAFHILLQFTPQHLNLDKIIADIEKVKGVEDVHEVHLWSLCSNINVIDAHISTKVRKLAQTEKIKKEIKRKLRKYKIKHTTLEFECEECINKKKIKELKH